MSLKLSKVVQEQIKTPSPIRQIMKMAEKQNIINMGLNPDNIISFGGGWVNHPAPAGCRWQPQQGLAEVLDVAEKSFAYNAANNAYFAVRDLRPVQNLTLEQLLEKKGISQTPNIIIS